MTTTIAQPYATGLARANIERALAAAGNQTDALRASDLAMLEDFHSLGRLATVALIDLAHISSGDRVLDAGAGIGGTARLIAAERGARVTAVDLTPEYCEVAEWLNDAVGLGDMVEVRTADVTELPFEAASFDVVVSQHVQMNIADKHRLYAEARRVLVTGGRLALWDVTAGPGGPLRLAGELGQDVADQFLERYRVAAARDDEYHPYWDISAAIGGLDEDADEAPSPADEAFLAAAVARL